MYWHESAYESPGSSKARLASYSPLSSARGLSRPSIWVCLCRGRKLTEFRCGPESTDSMLGLILQKAKPGAPRGNFGLKCAKTV
jgi:hypothetical protein